MIMDRNEIFELVIREMTETALLEYRKNCAEEEKQLYQETAALSKKRQEIFTRLALEDRQVLEDYFVKTNLIADHECKHLYVQGAKDCVELLKKLGVLQDCPGGKA